MTTYPVTDEAEGRAIQPSSDTIPARFWRQVERYGNRVALRKKEFGIWQETSWAEYGEHVRACAFGLIALGLQPGERVVILSEDRPEWFYADLGVQDAGSPEDVLKRGREVLRGDEVEI